MVDDVTDPRLSDLKRLTDVFEVHAPPTAEAVALLRQ